MRIFIAAALLCVSFETSAAPGRITVEKTGCYGYCAVYSLTLHPDDSYDWNGDAFVAVEGESHGRLPSGTYEGVLKRFESVRYREFADSYVRDEECAEWWTDSPSTTYTIVTGQGTKTIAHYHGCRGFDREVELLALEASLDRILRVPEIDGAIAPAARDRP